MRGNPPILGVTAVASAEQQHRRQGNPAAHGMHHNRAGKVVELGAKSGFQPRLNTESLIPGDAFKKRIDKANQHEVSTPEKK